MHYELGVPIHSPHYGSLGSSRGSIELVNSRLICIGENTYIYHIFVNANANAFSWGEDIALTDYIEKMENTLLNLK